MATTGISTEVTRTAESGSRSSGASSVVDRSAQNNAIAQGIGNIGQLVMYGLDKVARNRVGRKVLELDNKLATARAGGAGNIERDKIKRDYLGALISGGMGAEDVLKVRAGSQVQKLETKRSGDTIYQTTESGEVAGSRQVYSEAGRVFKQQNAELETTMPNMMAAWNSGPARNMINGELQTDKAEYMVRVQETGMNIMRFISNRKSHIAFPGGRKVSVAGDIGEDIKELGQEGKRLFTIYRRNLASKFMADRAEDPKDPISINELEALLDGAALDVINNWDATVQRETGISFDAMNEFLQKEKEYFQNFTENVIKKGATGTQGERLKLSVALETADMALNDFKAIGDLRPAMQDLLRKGRIGLTKSLAEAAVIANNIGLTSDSKAFFQQMLDPLEQYNIRGRIALLQSYVISGEEVSGKDIRQVWFGLRHSGGMVKNMKSVTATVSVMEQIAKGVEKENPDLAEDLRREVKTWASKMEKVTIAVEGTK